MNIILAEQNNIVKNEQVSERQEAFEAMEVVAAANEIQFSFATHLKSKLAYHDDVLSLT